LIQIFCRSDSIVADFYFTEPLRRLLQQYRPIPDQPECPRYVGSGDQPAKPRDIHAAGVRKPPRNEPAGAGRTTLAQSINDEVLF